MYGAASGGGAAAAPAAATSAPVLDFDLGGASQTAASMPDISLDEPAKGATATGLDLDLGATQTQKLPAAGDETVFAPPSNRGSGGLDFNFDLGAEDKKPEPSRPAPVPASEPSGLDFDLNLDLDKSGEPPKAEPTKVDLASISLDLDNIPGDPGAAGKASTDPKWTEVATKLDLAKAYEEMGDKDGARELLKEVVKEGDSAQQQQAQTMLAALG